MARFRRRRKKIVAAIRAAEKEVAHNLAPRLALLARDIKALHVHDGVYDSLEAPANPHSTTSAAAAHTAKKRNVASLQKRLREMDELLIRALENLDAIRPADMAVDITHLRVDNRPSSEPADKPTEVPFGQFIGSNTAASYQPPQNIRSSPVPSLSKTASNGSESPDEACSTSDHQDLLTNAPFVPDAHLSQPFKQQQQQQQSPVQQNTNDESSSETKHQQNTSFSQSFFSLFPPSLFFSTDELSPENSQQILDAVAQWRGRKRGIVRQIQDMANVVDKLFEGLVVYSA
ncbi:hypothetical protein HDU82_001791 [Entophlyctis luteolus]|nr:hypothetical protein HDU82_001791 [Entophlyctis luteolus]